MKKDKKRTSKKQKGDRVNKRIKNNRTNKNKKKSLRKSKKYIILKSYEFCYYKLKSPQWINIVRFVILIFFL